MMTPQEIIERITAAADYDDCIVIVESKTQANLRWASSTLTTNGVIAEQDVTVIGFVAVDGGMASGSVSRSSVELNDCAELAQLAGAAARAAGKAEDAAPLLTNKSFGDWAAIHPATGPSIFKSFVGDLGDMFKRSKADAIELFGYAEHTSKTTWVGSKGGLHLRFDQPDGRIEMNGKSHNRTRSTWEGVASRNFDSINVAQIDKTIRTRLDWQSRRAEMPAGKYQTVLPSGSIADLFTYMLWLSSGKDAADGISAFSAGNGKTRVGEKFANLPLNIYSDPSYQGIETSPYQIARSSSSMASVFDNGIDSGKTELFTKGALSNLVTNRATAAETGLTHSPWGDNVIIEVEGGKGSKEDLITQVKSGLLVTTLWYIRLVDPSTQLLTGLTRDGVYEIRDGEVIGAVNNFRWNDSPLEILKRIAAAGSTEITQPREWAGDVERVAAPAMVVDDFNMSTISQAN